MKTKKLNVLSLFDGVGTAYLALQKAGLETENYYSSEIDKSALSVLDYHYSGNTNFHQVGDVRQIDGEDFGHVDLVIFGSPCTQLSAVNTKDRSGLEGPDSSLFFEALRILKQISKHNENLYFLMENVASMPNKDRDNISNELTLLFGESVTRHKIDSALVAPAHRRRYYWTNIQSIQPPIPNEITYQDILVDGFSDRDKANVILTSDVTLTNGIKRYYTMDIGNIVFKDKEFANLSVSAKLERYPSILNSSGYIGKSKSLVSEYDFPNGCYRLPSTLELERMMTFPDGYISEVPNVSRTQKRKLIGLSFTCNVVSHLLGFIRLNHTQ